MNDTPTVKRSAQSDWSRRRLIGVSAAGLSLSLGLLVLIGWHVHSTALVQVHPTFVPMQYNTALGFILSRLGMLAAWQGRDYVSRSLGSLIVTIAVLTLAQYLFELGIGIDELFMKHYITVATSHPGRMAPNTAICFALTGIFLLSKNWVGVTRFPQLANALLGSVVLALGSVAFLGYVSGIETAYGWGHVTQMAVHTSLGFVCIGIGLTALAWHRQLVHSAGPPWWIPVPIGVAGLAATICFWQALDASEFKHATAAMQRNLDARAAILSEVVRERMFTLERMALRWAVADDPGSERLAAEAEIYLGYLPALQALTWSGSSGSSRWIVPRERQDLFAAIESREQALLEVARQEQRAAISQTFEVPTNGRVFLIVVPILHNDRSQRWLSGIFHVPTLLDGIFADRRTVLVERSPSLPGESAPDEYRIVAPVELPGVEWALERNPTPDELRDRGSRIPEVALGLGSIFSLLLMLAVYLVQISFERSRALRESLVALEKSSSLRASLAAIVDSSDDAVIGKTLDGIITSWNRGAENLYGYPAEQMLGESYSVLIPAGFTNELPESIERLKRGERVDHIETVRMRSDGSLVHVSVTVSPIRDDEGQMAGASVIARDISDRKALENQRRDFLAMLTHDIKNPLLVITGMVEILREEGTLDADTIELLAAIEVNADTVLSLVTNHLSVARIEAGEITLSRRAVDLGVLLRRVVDHYAIEAGRRHVLLRYESEPLPPIQADPQALERVFLNLVHNGLKFTQNGGRVTVASTVINQEVLVEVADTGPGIRADEQSRLFQRYQQTATGRTKKGTGMGLFIVKTLVEAHGGSVGICSTVGQGTAFQVFLPMAEYRAVELKRQAVR